MKYAHIVAAAAAVPAALFGVTAAQATGDGPYRGGSSFVDGTIWQEDVAPALDKVYKTTYNDTVGIPALKADVKAEIAKGTIQADTHPVPVPVKNVGGSVFAADAATVITMEGVALQPGHTYLLEYSAQVEATVPAVAGDPDVRPQIMPWANLDEDSTFNTDEAVPGAVSANTVLPRVTGRHATMAGSVVYTVPMRYGLPEDIIVHMQLGAHAYADDGSSAREGDFAITTATLSATLII
jgi:hypothetical protein